LSHELNIARNIIVDLIKGIEEWGKMEDGVPDWFWAYLRAKGFLQK